jgi:hypothetical protein
MSKKEYFDKPVVRADTQQIRYPRICPVCTERATKVARISIRPGKQYLRPTWDPRFYPRARRRMGPVSAEMKTIAIPVCEDHLYYDESDCRLKMICLIGNGFFGAFFMFAFFSFGNSFWLGMTISNWFFLSFGIFLASLFATSFVFRPNTFQKHVRLVGFDTGLQYVWFEFKNESYRDEFLKENPMSAELITWVVRG